MKGTYNPCWLYNSNNELMGVRLGYGSFSEHESGIYRLQNMCGIVDTITEDKQWLWQNTHNYLNDLQWFVDGLHKTSKPLLGIERRRINKVPIVFVNTFNYDYYDNDNKDFAILTVSDYFHYGITEMVRHSNYIDITEDTKKYNFHSLPIIRKNKNLACGWHSNAFEIIVTTEYQPYLYDIEKAFWNKDVALYIDYDIDKHNHNLMLLILSRLDEADIQYLENKDKELFNIGYSLLGTELYNMLSVLQWCKCIPYFENEVLYFNITFVYNKKNYSYWHKQYFELEEQLKQIIKGE